jgi:hypothetical protein
MNAIGVPYHLDEPIPGFDFGVRVDLEVIGELPPADFWQCMDVLDEEVAPAVCSHERPVLVISGLYDQPRRLGRAAASGTRRGHRVG